MKIIHFADLHIGHENYGRLDEKSGLNTRLLDFLKSFDYLIDYAFEHKIDLIVFAGDAYKTRDPNPTYQREFAKRIRKLASRIPVVLITGNHDIPPSFGKADTLEIFPALEVPNVYVFSKPTVQEIPISDNQQLITIVALPWVGRTILIKESERKKSPDQIRTILSSRLAEIFQKLLHQLDPKKPAIALVHQSVSGATFPSNQGVYLGSDPIIPVSVLAHPYFSYVALGHIHKFQVLNEKPPVLYSGSIERIDFGEEKSEKGFIEAEIDENGQKKTKWRFIPVPARKFITLEIKISEKETSPNNYVLKKIRQAKISDAVVRITIEGREESLVKILESDLREATKKAYYLASVSKKSPEKMLKIEIRPEELAPLDWLTKYLENKNLKKEEIKMFREAARRLMEE